MRSNDDGSGGDDGDRKMKIGKETRKLENNRRTLHGIIIIH